MADNVTSPESYYDPPSMPTHMEQDTLLPDSSNLSPTNTNFQLSPTSQSYQHHSLPTRQVPSRSGSSHFISSPLNPANATNSSSPPSASAHFSSHRSRPASRSSHFDPMTSSQRESNILGLTPPSLSPSSMPGTRASMILYRLASPLDDDNDKEKEPTISDSHLLPPPKFPNRNRDSIISASGSSFGSLDVDSKYDASLRYSTFPSVPRGLVPYAYDPAVDEMGPIDDEDLLHDPQSDIRLSKKYFPWRGILNVIVLISLTLGLLSLFVFYPVFLFYRDEARHQRIEGNLRINGTGMVSLFLYFFDRMLRIFLPKAKLRSFSRFQTLSTKILPRTPTRA